MQGKVDKHTNPDSQFVRSHGAKHRVPKKFSRNNPTRRQGPRVRTLEHTLPEEISLDEEDKNEADVSSQSDNDEDYQPHVFGNGEICDEPDDIVPPALQPAIPECSYACQEKTWKESEIYEHHSSRIFQ